jgi:hypothetical protein
MTGAYWRGQRADERKESSSCPSTSPLTSSPLSPAQVSTATHRQLPLRRLLQLSARGMAYQNNYGRAPPTFQQYAPPPNAYGGPPQGSMQALLSNQDAYGGGGVGVGDDEYK